MQVIAKLLVVDIGSAASSAMKSKDESISSVGSCAFDKIFKFDSFIIEGDIFLIKHQIVEFSSLHLLSLPLNGYLRLTQHITNNYINQC